MSSRFETRLNDSKKFNPIYTPTKSNSNSNANPKQSDTQNIESKNEESKVDSSKEVQNKNINKNTNKNTNNRYKKYITGIGQIYKNKEIFIETPEKDVVLGIDNVERDIYVEEVQITNGIASLVVTMSETITYSTCNKKALEEMYDENGDIVKTNVNFDYCIVGLQESYVISVKIKVVFVLYVKK